MNFRLDLACIGAENGEHLQGIWNQQWTILFFWKINTRTLKICFLIMIFLDTLNILHLSDYQVPLQQEILGI